MISCNRQRNLIKTIIRMVISMFLFRNDSYHTKQSKWFQWNHFNETDSHLTKRWCLLDSRNDDLKARSWKANFRKWQICGSFVKLHNNNWSTLTIEANQSAHDHWARLKTESRSCWLNRTGVEWINKSAFSRFLSCLIWLLSLLQMHLLAPSCSHFQQSIASRLRVDCESIVIRSVIDNLWPWFLTKDALVLAS